MRQHLLNGEETAVVHVRVRHHHVTQGRHFEFGEISWIPGRHHSARIGESGIEPIVPVGIVGEQWFLVTRSAMLLKQLITLLLLRRKARFSLPHLVVLRIRGRDHAHELRQRL